ncbi:MAG: beta-ketoacyl synthase chain length factor [Betaproteobacteria bacterium]
MRVSVAAVGVLAPGMMDWGSVKDVLSGAQDYSHAELDVPAPACLAPAERRRSSPTVRLAISVAEQALRHTTMRPEDMAMVFSSYEAAGQITHQLCEVLAGSREVSPTQFHNSVHNAPSGYYSIAMNARLGATSVCRGEWSFAAGLLNAVAQVVADNIPVLYVCYDSPLPSPMREVMPVTESTAIALVLTPQNPSSMATWEVSTRTQAVADDWPEWMPATWHANACAHGFAALRSLACEPGRPELLALSPELGLEVRTC